MCYSALVNQQIKTLGLSYQARVQLDIFESLFESRLQGSRAKIPRAMELAFLEDPRSRQEQKIAKLIRQFTEQELQASEQELFAQKKRLSVAERALLGKVTKKAQNDQRVAGSKIEKLLEKIHRLQSEAPAESNSRIYPGQYAPLVTIAQGERIIAPFRYLLRPRGQSPEFDRKFSGCYNARRDSLDRVFWWKSAFGRNHGFMEIQSFWENVKKHEYEKRKLKPAEEEENLILKFTPESLSKMIVPCIFDENREGPFPLHSFALITDEPNPEVAAAGHNRTPIIMKDQYIDLWLKTGGKDLSLYEEVFEDKQPTYFLHQIAA